MDITPHPKRHCIEAQGGMEQGGNTQGGMEQGGNTQGGVAAGQQQQQKCMSVGYAHYIQNAFSSPLC